MLDIPEKVKNLFRQDSITKNFRVHFPNGERADLVNKDIVSESVQFTESLCSQENLKFGLCEASVLEFETIGVGNIKGCEIEAGIEIDITSLGEEFIAEYGQTSEDVPFPFYYVPYGVFTVDSCKRQSNMDRRQVVAYTQTLNEETPFSAIEKYKQGLIIAENVPYRFNIVKFIYSNFPDIDFANVQRNLLTTFNDGSDKGISIDVSPLCPSTFFTYDGKRCAVRILRGIAHTFHYFVKDSAVFVGKDFRMQSDELLEIKIEGEKFEKEVNNAIQFFSEKYKIPNYVADFIKENTLVKYGEIYMVKKEYTGAEKGFSESYARVSTDKKHVIVYPYISGVCGDGTASNGMANRMEVQLMPRVYLRVEMYDEDDQKWRKLETIQVDCADRIDFYSVSLEDNPLNRMTLSYPRTKADMGGYYSNPKSQTINLKDLVNGYVELNGMFLKSARDGTYTPTNIRNSFGLYPSEDLYPSEYLYPNETADIISTYDYKSSYLEEHDVQPIGKLVVNYKDPEGNMQIFTYTIDESARNIYEIKDNFILNAGILTKEQIEEILVNNFIPNIRDIRYTPTDLQAKGLPFLEAGDVVNVLTKDGGFESFVLRRTLTSIQNLSDSIESSGDEVNMDSYEAVAEMEEEES